MLLQHNVEEVEALIARNHSHATGTVDKSNHVNFYTFASIWGAEEGTVCFVLKSVEQN